MLRPDRLHQIIDILRSGGLHRAEDLADRLQVTPRTIYRDMDRLKALGLPLEGTRGQGYRITDSLALPPLQLSPDELEALNLGLAIVAQAADPALREAAGQLADKIDAALPLGTVAGAAAWALEETPFADPTRTLAHLPLLRAAVQARQKVRLTYTDPQGRITARTVRPLHVDYWGTLWSLLAWCEMANDFKSFRLDLVTTLEALPELFVDEEGKRLADYIPPSRA
ncbi:MAG: YafY family protein [Sulfitobacter sp.]|nr:YafY family protein [Sulfitobacter sp.]